MMLKNLHQATKEKARRRRKQQIRTTKTKAERQNHRSQAGRKVRNGT